MSKTRVRYLPNFKSLKMKRVLVQILVLCLEFHIPCSFVQCSQIFPCTDYKFWTIFNDSKKELPDIRCRHSRYLGSSVDFWIYENSHGIPHLNLRSFVYITVLVLLAMFCCGHILNLQPLCMVRYRELKYLTFLFSFFSEWWFRLRFRTYNRVCSSMVIIFVYYKSEDNKILFQYSQG